MIGVISNPKKTFQIEKNIEDIRSGAEDIYLFTKKYSFIKSDTILNSCTYSTTELLSLGVWIHLSYSIINEKRTEVTIEIERKIGSFDRSHEVTMANTHLANISDLLSKSLSFDKIERLDKIAKIEATKQNKIDKFKKKQEEAKVKNQLQKENNPFLYYALQTFYVLATIGVIAGAIAGLIYFVYFLENLK